MSDDAKKACHDVLHELGRCISETECFKSGNTFEQCLKAKDLGDCNVRASAGNAATRGIQRHAAVLRSHAAAPA